MRFYVGVASMLLDASVLFVHHVHQLALQVIQHYRNLQKKRTVSRACFASARRQLKVAQVHATDPSERGGTRRHRFG